MELKRDRSQTFKLKNVEVNPSFNNKESIFKGKQPCISMNMLQINRLTRFKKEEVLAEDAPQPSDHSIKNDGQNFKRASSCIRTSNNFTSNISPIPIFVDIEQELPEIPNISPQISLPQELPSEGPLTNHTSNSSSIYRKKLIDTPNRMKHIKSSSYVSTAANVTKSELDDTYKKFTSELASDKHNKSTPLSFNQSKSNFNSRNQCHPIKSKQDETLTNPEFVTTLINKKGYDEKSIRVIRELDSYTTNSRDCSNFSKSFFYENSSIFRDLICRGKHQVIINSELETSNKKNNQNKIESKRPKSQGAFKFSNLDLDQYLVYHIKNNSLKVIGDAVTYDEKLFVFYLEYLDYMSKQYSSTAFKLIKQRLDKKLFGSLKYIRAINSTVKFTITKLLQSANLKIYK